MQTDSQIGYFATFVSRAVESAFRQQRFGDERWLCCFLVVAWMLRVAALVLADYQHFGSGPEFWPLLAFRGLFLGMSACAFVALRRASSPAAMGRLFLAWGFGLIAITVYSLSARVPENTNLLLMSFVMVIAVYCVAPLPLLQQMVLALPYSAAALWVCRSVDSATLMLVGAIYALANLFGAALSWRLNSWLRAAFLTAAREASLRAELEKAMGEIKTLRGMLCVCAWCRRVRDEDEAWQALETFVQERTHAAFTHGICPDCFQSQLEQVGQ